jgi:hypothetical protein
MKKSNRIPLQKKTYRAIILVATVLRRAVMTY